MKKKLSVKEKIALKDFACEAKNILGDNLVKILLYGSKARGDFHKDSDIDVALIVKRKNWKEKSQILDLVYHVDLKHGIFISPRLLPQKILNAFIWRKTPFILNLKREGTLL